MKIGSGAKVTSKAGVNVKNQKSHEEVIKTFKRGKVCARFKYNIYASDLAGMGLLTSKNQSVKYLLGVIDFFTKYASV